MGSSGRFIGNVDDFAILEDRNTCRAASDVYHRAVLQFQYLVGGGRFIEYIADFETCASDNVCDCAAVHVLCSRRDRCCCVDQFVHAERFFQFLFHLSDHVDRADIIHDHAVPYHGSVLVRACNRFEVLIQYHDYHAGGTKVHADVIDWFFFLRTDRVLDYSLKLLYQCVTVIKVYAFL